MFNRIAPIAGTPASCARLLGVSWSTAMSAVRRHGQQLIDDPLRVGVTVQVGFDETVMSPARHLARRRFITATVDVQSGQIIDVFNGRDARDLREWLGGQPVWWRDGIEVVSMDPHEGYRSAIKASFWVCQPGLAPAWYGRFRRSWLHGGYDQLSEQVGGGRPAKGFAWPVVEFIGYPLEVLGTVNRQVSSLWEVLA